MKNKICENVNCDEQFYECKPMDSFMRRYQHLHANATSWEKYDPLTVLVEMQNGDIYCYDWPDQKVMKIKVFLDARELTEQEWRNGLAFFLDRAIFDTRMTHQEVAERVDITNVMLSRYLSAKATPGGYVIQKLADVLGRRVEEIIPHDFVPLK